MADPPAPSKPPRKPRKKSAPERYWDEVERLRGLDPEYPDISDPGSMMQKLPAWKFESSRGTKGIMRGHPSLPGNAAGAAAHYIAHREYPRMSGPGNGTVDIQFTLTIADDPANTHTYKASVTWRQKVEFDRPYFTSAT